MNNQVYSSKNSVYFLFINGPHHVHHLIGPALTFASIQNKYKTIIVSGCPNNTSIIKKVHKSYKNAKFKLIEIAVPLRYKFKWYKKDKLYPPPYNAFGKIVFLLRDASAIVTTSHLIPKLIKKYRINNPFLFYLYHGMGTRAYGFEESQGEFDYLLIPGKYYKDRLISEGVCKKEQLALVGHPKFDWLNNKTSKNNKLFNNNNPIFYYNPHWELEISSFIKWRNIILEFFKKNIQYNLIFSPHPLIKHNAYNKNYSINHNLEDAENIIIDFESEKLLDETYIKNADVYIGDVSRMAVYWVIKRPRPCIFINAHGINWANDESYIIWNFGIVIEKQKYLAETILKSLNNKDYELKQKNLKDSFIYTNKTKSSSTLCAEFLIEKLVHNREK